MDRANSQKIQDLEKLPTTSPAADELRLLKQADIDSRRLKMRGLRHGFFALLLVVVLTAGFVYASPSSVRCSKVASGALQTLPNPANIHDPSSEDLQDLLNGVDPASLHEVLHIHLKDKFQDGVYQEDKTALEAIHKQDPEVAHSLMELVKRQAGGTNGTVVTTTPPTSTPETTPTQESTPTVAPSSTPQTSATPSTQETSQQPQQTSPSSQAPTSAPTSNTPSPTPTSTNRASTPLATTQTPSSTANTASHSSTNQPSQTSTRPGSSSTTGPSSSATTQASTSEGASTTESSGSSETPPASITQDIVFKTTLANGAVSTVTSVTVVPGAAGDRGSSSSKTNTANASLQTGGGSQKSLGINVVMGALGLAAVAAL